MYSTNVYLLTGRSYLLTQKHTVVVYSGNSTRRYSLVYAKNLKLHKGVENRLQFQFLNQEQKPVNITGKTVTFRLISYDGTKVLLQTALVSTLPLTGIAELRTTAGELVGIDPQNATYSLEITDPAGEASPYEGYPHFPVFTNSDAGGRGPIQVVSSIMPDFTSATSVAMFEDASELITSSDTGITTLQIFYDTFGGTVSIKGSTLKDAPDGDFYPIEDITVVDTTGSAGYTITGYHPYLKVFFIADQGSITKILAR